MNDERAETLPVQPLLGLLFGAISGVIYPGLYLFLFPTWVIPAVIALTLQFSSRTRALAVGFGAASVGWLAYSIAFYVFGIVGNFMR